MSALRVAARAATLAVLIVIVGALSGCVSSGNRDYADTSFSGVNSGVNIPGQYTSPHVVY